MWWTFLPHPPYSPDLAPSNFHDFRSLMDALRGRRCAEEKLDVGVRREQRIFSRDFLRDRHTVVQLTQINFSILCLTRDFIRQGHAREKRKVYRVTRTRSQAIDRR